MSTVVKLGMEPKPFHLRLSEGADFLANLYWQVDGVRTNWPAGTGLSLVITTPTGVLTWSATISGAQASFSQDKAATSAASVPALSKAVLRYVNGTTDTNLLIGKVVRYD